MTTTPPDARNALAEIVAGLDGVTPGPWGVWREPTPSKYDAIAELSEQVQLTEPFVGAVYLINAGGKCPAETGCGPCSEANAHHIARLDPTTIRSIADYVAALEAQVEGMRVAQCNAAHLLSLMRDRPTDRHTLTYTNYRGEKSERELHLVRLWWGGTEWHPEPQLLLSAFDYQKDAYRAFAVKDFDFRAALQSSETTGEKP